MRSTSMYRTGTTSNAYGYSTRSTGYSTRSTGYSTRGSVYTPAYGSVRTMVNTTYRPGANVMGTSIIGTTSADTYGNMSGAMNRVVGRRVGNPNFGDDADEEEGYCDQCIDLDNDGVCDRCGCDMDDCDCDIESGYCWCPLDFDASAMIFMTMLCVAYVAWKNRGEKEEQEEFI